MQIEIVLHGVEKKDISLKITEDGFYVRATKEGAVYAENYAVCCLVSPEKVIARHSNGVLKLQYPYQQPFENAVDVKIK